MSIEEKKIHLFVRVENVIIFCNSKLSKSEYTIGFLMKRVQRCSIYGN